MSNIDKQALRERYSPKPVPKCHICGEEMTIQRISASRITYGCKGEGDDGYFKFGRTFADEHYEKSRVTVVDVSDPDVLALLDELEAETGYREGAFIACNRWHDKFRETEDKLECAERRIAELEAKLETADKLQDSAFRDGLKAGFSYRQTDDQSGFAQCMSAYSNAGISVKQQEDSVDSDVGRNQPGMVVAVHIGAGDFVKVKGQVFEVEETDFDDHDVTLWFVGGNALKCAAGCPVEVVSAPVAAGIKVKGE
ncbi:ead/Ea22-like family protein [Salmonella enterica subsp. enterica serovar Javiana]|nr:ead/Ea22-like family protein [Salmonella enterica]ECQ3780584.1 ead/Ea22-like family protein [Salmonella enterica]EDX8238706.1 ead/Ea22-like family protein [Salmonella enterica subsp. enterica serovar Javiana]ELP7768890.1 ead/Ea22-like family protein [Salmonella enterica]